MFKSLLGYIHGGNILQSMTSNRNARSHRGTRIEFAGYRHIKRKGQGPRSAETYRGYRRNLRRRA